jgi:hypothetical protein
MRREIDGTNSLINFGRLLIEMNKLNESEQSYDIVHRQTDAKNDPRTITIIHNDLGYIASQRGWKYQALEQYTKALSIGTRTISIA